MAVSTRTKRAAAVLLVVAAGAAAMAWLGHKSVYAERVVPAPAGAIWEVLTDSGGYAEWNPILVRAEGTYDVGATIRYRMRDESGSESDVRSTVIALEERRLLRQFGGMRGILTFEHTWHLEPVAGGTRVVQHEEYRGIGVWFWDPSGVQRLYERANESLSRRVAARATPRDQAPAPDETQE